MGRVQPCPGGRITNIARLSEMLDAAAVALLVMTAEDEHASGKMQAPMNVVHEAGLFQGRLGFTKAIVLLEEGCEEFSNIQGLGQVHFPKGNIKAAFEESASCLSARGSLMHRDRSASPVSNLRVNRTAHSYAVGYPPRYARRRPVTSGVLGVMTRDMVAIASTQDEWTIHALNIHGVFFERRRAALGTEGIWYYGYSPLWRIRPCPFR